MVEVQTRKMFRILSMFVIAGFSLALLFALLLPTETLAQTDEANDSATSSVRIRQARNGVVKVNANVHAEPRVNATVVRKALAGENVIIIDSNDSETWLHIGEDEWIPALLVQLEQPSALDGDSATASTDILADETITQAESISTVTTVPAKTTPTNTVTATTTNGVTTTSIVLTTTIRTKPAAITLGALLQAESTSITTATTNLEGASPADDITSTQSVTNTQTPPTIEVTSIITRQVGVINQRSNLRAGPGVTFDVVDQADLDQQVEILQVDDDSNWIEIEPEIWIAGFLVDITGEITVAVSSIMTSTPTVTQIVPLPDSAQLTETVTISTVQASATLEPLPFERSPAYANRSANLRTGPGTEYEIGGGVVSGEPLAISGRNDDESWYYLENELWIAAFLVADSPPTPTPIPPTPVPAATATASPASAEAPVEEASIDPAPIQSSSEEFKVIDKRLWDVYENGGHLDGPSVHCGYKRELHVHVLDRNGNRMNGVQVQVVYGAREIAVTGSQGIGDGVASFVLGKGQDVEIVRAPDGREVTSEIARGLVTEPQYIDPQQLRAGNYCTDDASCRAFIEGNSCYAHYSWTVTFQEQ